MHFLKSFSEKKVLILILIFAFIIRIIALNEIPPGSSFDEIQVIENASSIAKTGKQIPGTLTGTIGSSSGDIQTGVFSELGSYILAIWSFIFGTNWPFIKLPFIMTSLSIIVFVYFIAKKLTDKKCATIAAIIFTINPWSIYLGRTAYESLFSFFFYLFAIYVFINFEGKKILFSIPALILGFLTYFASKPQFPFIILSGILFNYLSFKKNFRKNIKFLLITTISLISFFIFYTFLFIGNPSSLRLSEIKSQKSYESLVNQKRRESIPSILNYFSVNKFSEEFRERATAYLGALSPNFLFLEGHTWGPEFLIISSHGPMYLLDLPLIILGLVALSRRKPKSLAIILIVISISLIPNAVSLSARNYILRDGLLFPMLAILSSSGIWIIKTSNIRKNIKFSILAIIFFLYLLSFVNFVNQYFFHTPVEKNEGWNLQNRVLAHYLLLSSNELPLQKNMVLTNDLNGVSYIYLLFSKKYDSKEQIVKVNSAISDLSYDFGEVRFSQTCLNIKDEKTTLISDTKINCPDIKSEDKKIIASPKDGGGKYIIYNDKLCENEASKRYPEILKLNDLKIELLDKKEFCSKWIINPG